VKIHRLMMIIGLICLAIVLIFNAHQFSNFIHLIKSLRWYIVVLIVVVQLISYYLNALYYRSILRIFDHNIKLMRLFEGALSTNFVNYVTPTVGLAGAGFLSQVLSPEVPRGEGVLSQLVRYAFSSLAVLLMMPIGFGLILLGNHSSQSVIKISVIASLVIIGLAMALIGLIHQELVLRRLAGRIEIKLLKIFTKLKKKSLGNFVDEFYIGYRLVVHQKRRMLAPFGWSIIYIIVEILTLYMSFLAFGKAVNPGIAVMGYVLANIASVFGGTFFSTGVFELGMLGTFVALGVPFALALSVIVVYRVLNLLIGLPPGFYYYRKYLPK